MELTLITGVERSGSSMISRILLMCGAFGGDVNPMYENKALKSYMQLLLGLNTPYQSILGMMDFTNSNISPKTWNKVVTKTMKNDGWKSEPVIYKDSTISELWPIWNKAYPDAKWIIVRRRTADIVNSCIHTAYMRKFKNPKSLKALKVGTEAEGWLWWVREYEKRFAEIVKVVPEDRYRIVWPERMATGNFEQMKEVIQWCGLEWNPDVEKVIEPLFKK